MQSRTQRPTRAQAEETVSALFALLEAQGSAPYLGEPVSQLEHSLQTAQLASSSGADEETILAALLHDVGHFLPASQHPTTSSSTSSTSSPATAGSTSPAPIQNHPTPQSTETPSSLHEMFTTDGTSLGTSSHEILGEAYLVSLGFTPKLTALVGAHVLAKRFLCATDPSYYGKLSEASKETLRLQGGPFSEEEVGSIRRADRDSEEAGGEGKGKGWLEGMLMVRRWDDMAKVVEMETTGLEGYRNMAVGNLMRGGDWR